MLKAFTTGAATALVLALAIPVAHSETLKFKAKLDAPSEVPANDSAGTGKANLKYDTDTKDLKYTLSYKGLTGDASAAHFHGPADPGANGGVELPITIGKSPIKGEATLTDAQAADLLAGKWYVNVHTAAHPGGEIRGQVTQVTKKKK
jgi:hypothetical protein